MESIEKMKQDIIAFAEKKKLEFEQTSITNIK